MRPVRSGTGDVVAPGNVVATRAATASAWRGSTSSISLRRGDVSPYRGEQRPVGVEPVLAAEERAARFEVAHVAVHRLELLGGDVGRVADDEVEVRPRAQSAHEHSTKSTSTPSAVALARATSSAAALTSVATRAWRGNLGGERDRRCSRCRSRGRRRAARAPGRSRRYATALLHQRLGVGPRHEHVGRDRKRPPVELAGPGDVRHRFALPAPPDQLADRGQLLLVERPVELQVQVDAAQPERLRAEQLGVEARRRAAVITEVGGAETEHVDERWRGRPPPQASCPGGAPSSSSSSSRRAWSSLDSGSMSRSRSPSSTRWS